MNPEKIGRYEIKAELGRGGMATVYQAYDPRFERDVAIKVLPREMLHDPQFRARFEREAKTIAMLEHPAIVPVYDFGEEDGQPYFVMRHMTGGSLSDRMNQGPITVKEAARIIERLAPGLDEAHARNIVHRDLKPGNILFDRLNEPYVSDFGIAKLSEAQANLTGSAVIGTPTYMSPEQAQGEPVDWRSDIYALGVILFEMLSGKPPYKADTPMGVVVKHITEPVPHILDVNSNLPQAIEAVIQKVMAKDKQARFATCAELASTLSAIERGEALDPKTLLAMPRITSTQTVVARRGEQPKSRTEAIGPVSAPRKKTGLWIGLGAATVLLCAGMLSVFLFIPGLLPFTLFPTKALATKTIAIPASPTSITLLPSEIATLPLALVPTITVTPPSTPTNMTTPSITSTIVNLPMLGGADMIAFLNANNVWVMGVDGSGLSQLTTDGAVKHDLQWMPDGQGVLYITGKCIQIVNLENKEVRDLTCFPAAEYLEAFQFSLDGTQVAISLNRELYVVPFDLEKLSQARSHSDLAAMNGCLTYTKLATKGVRWSNDGQKIAVLILGVGDNGLIENMVYVLDIHRCSAAEPIRLDIFPASRFSMSGFKNNPVIPSFNWDGLTLFLLNSDYRNDGFGFLYNYNLETYKAALLDPLGSTCCYRDTRWSPDGNYIAFAYQDIRLGASSPTQLFYIPYSAIGSGASNTPFSLPSDFFPDPREKPQPALRPAR
jgi:tRNA A-37 threonylcarbamoyl transferase component Bud32